MPFNVTITNIIPTITEAYKQQGYLPRYFAARANHINNEVFEITRRDYEVFLDNSYVMVGHLNWTIKGKLDDHTLWVYTGSPIYDDAAESPQRGTDPIIIPGLLTQNRAAVKFLSKRIPSLQNRLTDYREYYHGV